VEQNGGLRTGGSVSDLQAENPCDQLGAVFDAEPGIDIMKVVFHGLFGNMYSRRYLAVRKASDDIRQDLLLPRRKLQPVLVHLMAVHENPRPCRAVPHARPCPSAADITFR